MTFFCHLLHNIGIAFYFLSALFHGCYSLVDLRNVSNVGIFI